MSARSSDASAAGDGSARAGEEAYRESGVDLSAAARAVAAVEELAQKATRPEVVSGVGGFAGLVSLGDGRLLAAATDGAGTKLEVARLAGKLATVGIDVVAMCANDVICSGAEPLFFLDYVAAGKLVPEDVAALVAGVAEGCRRAGCALVGGETAEHPGILEEGRFDLAGFCVGLVNEEDLLDPRQVRAGDRLLGFPSSGLHANGYSLVRRALVEGASSLDQHLPELGRTLGEELLEPTAIYVRPLLALARAGLARAAAHITGGGLQENVPRALTPELGALIDTSAWEWQPVFSLLAERAGLDRLALSSVVNVGIGMVVIVPDGAEERALRVARATGTQAVVVGEVVDSPGVRFL